MGFAVELRQDVENLASGKIEVLYTSSAMRTAILHCLVLLSFLLIFPDFAYERQRGLYELYQQSLDPNSPLSTSTKALNKITNTVFGVDAPSPVKAVEDPGFSILFTPFSWLTIFALFFLFDLFHYWIFRTAEFYRILTPVAAAIDEKFGQKMRQYELAQAEHEVTLQSRKAVAERHRADVRAAKQRHPEPKSEPTPTMALKDLEREAQRQHEEVDASGLDEQSKERAHEAISQRLQDKINDRYGQ
ncbi:MAG: hypothetical protein K1Y02_13325 [Candidatus Hydrogenedentes bacterium]|nr:hypothetical protein [Candidatus Hydrogenedentota bacterium]